MPKQFSFSIEAPLLCGFAACLKSRCERKHAEALHDLPGKTMTREARQAAQKGSLTMSSTGYTLC